MRLFFSSTSRCSISGLPPSRFVNAGFTSSFSARSGPSSPKSVGPSNFSTRAKAVAAFWIFLGFEALFLALYFGDRWRCRRFALRSASAGVAAENALDAGGTQTRASQSEASTGPASPNNWLVAAAGIVAFTALVFSFWFSAIPALARPPLFFFGFVFLADAGLLALPVIGRAHRGIALGAGVLAFALVAEWIALFAEHAPVFAPLAAIVLFALLHAATVPAAAWRPGLLPLTAGGTLAPFILLLILIGRVEFWNPTPVFFVAFLLAAILLAAAIVRRADWLAAAAFLGTWLTELTWQGLRFSDAQALPALIWYGLFLFLFVAFPFCSAEKEKARPWAISSLAQAGQFWLFLSRDHDRFP